VTDLRPSLAMIGLHALLHVNSGEEGEGIALLYIQGKGAMK